MASTKLTRTPSGAGNKKTFTWSGWVKRSGLGAIQGLFTVDTGSGESAFGFLADDTLRLYLNIASNYPTIVTNQVFRDTSAWYHIAFAVDTTQSTEADRVKIYVNGSQVTSFSSASYPTQNADTDFNTTNPHEIGFYSNQTGGAGYFDGQLAHVHFTDGYAYAASSFGSTATNGQWVPNLNPSVTYGTNGYFLKFTNASDLGEDFSGNNNDYTKSGSGDKVLDNPENVFATLNSTLPISATATYTNGNLSFVGTSYRSPRSTLGISTGKFYFEMLRTSTADDVHVGIATDTETGLDTWVGSTSTGYIYAGNDGQKYNNGSGSSYGATFTTNDIIGVAVDMDAGTLKFYKNNSDQGTAFTGLSGTVFPVTSGGGAVTLNFGQDSSFAGGKTAQNNADGNGEGDFYYTPPSGFLALCSNNLSSSLTLPIGKGGSYMNTLSYTGSGATRSLTGVGFQPDFTWIKESNNAVSHRLFDSIRGATKRIFSNNEDAESTQSNALTSFDSDGFSLGDGGSVNGSSDTYAAWNWRASGSSATNNNGSVTTTVSANTTSGFSVVGFTSPGSGSYTLGHGLSSAPDLIIYKCRGASSPWWTFFTLLDGSVDYVKLNDTTAKADDSASLAVPTSTVFSLVDNYAPTSQPSIAYCFHSVEGFSKIGKYPGNGSSNGPFVYTGFRPSFILMKSATSGENWLIYDDVRDPHNVTDQALLPNLNSATGGASNAMDMYSNGFKLRSSSGSVNNSGQTYIYLAFARNPFVDSSGVPANAR